MHVKGTVLFATTTVISIILLRNSMQSSKWYINLVNVTQIDAFKEDFDKGILQLQDEIQSIYRKFENEEKIINTTAITLHQVLQSIDKQIYVIITLTNDTLSDLQNIVNSQTEQLNDVYEEYFTKLNGVPSIKPAYQDVKTQIEILKYNTAKKLNESRHEITEKIEKWQDVENDLVQIIYETVAISDNFNDNIINNMINEINEAVRHVKQQIDKKINKVINDMRLKVYSISDDNEREIKLDDFVSDARIELQAYFYKVENLMLQIDLQVQSAIEIETNDTLTIVQRNRKKLDIVKQYIIEFVQIIDTSINDKNSSIDDAVTQIENLSKLRVTLLTENDETPLNYNDTVPYFGVMPYETLSSHITDGNKSVITTYSTRSSDGFKYIREVKKEEMNGKIIVTETFYNEEGNIDSENSYEFTYVD